MKKIFDILDNECWWGGGIIWGNEMPFTKDTNIKLDFRGITTYDAKNQHAPFLLSNMGRYICFTNTKTHSKAAENVAYSVC